MTVRRGARWSIGAALCMTGASALWSCQSMGGSQRVDPNALAQQNNAFFQEQLRLAREALARQEWNAARQDRKSVV